MERDNIFEKYYQAALNDIFIVDETYSSIFKISDNVQAINRANFGHLFGRIQENFRELMIIAVGRLFDVSRNVLSLPGMLAAAPRFSLMNKDGLLDELRKLNISEQTLQKISREGLSEGASVELSRHFPARKNFPELDRVINMRHKEIAHRDSLAEKFERPAFLDVRACLNIAKDWLACFALGVKNTSLKDNRGHFFISDDAEATSRTIGRVLESLFVVPPESPFMLDYIAKEGNARLQKLKADISRER